jgi:PAS domain S-box-containing protein
MVAQGLPRVEQIQHWQTLLDSACEGIWGLDRDGNCMFVNQIAINSFGFSSEELVGGDMHQLVHHHYPDGRHFPYEDCPLHHVMRENKSFTQMTDTMFRKDGSPFVAELSAQPVILEGELMGVVVTFREVAEIEEQKARGLVERQTDGLPHDVSIAMLDATVKSNSRTKKMNGEDSRREVKTKEAPAGESLTHTVRASAERWIRNVAEPIHMNEKGLSGKQINTDVIQTGLQEEALRKLEKLAAVGQLASSIAHEINNPLESITNLLYLIQQSESMGDVQQYAKLAQEELSRVTDITLQTLRFHRQNSRPISLDLAELLRTVMVLYAGRMLVRNITTEMKVIPSPNVMAMEGEIRQVINNLVRNALDALNTGGRLLIRLHPERDRHNGCNGVRLTVADTGEGISPQIQARLFEPFQTTKELTGTGLGLWVSKGIVQKHRGRIQARTRRGCGTVFTVWLPVDGAASLTAQAD